MNRSNVDIIRTDFGGTLAVGDRDDALHAIQDGRGYDMVVFTAREVPPPPQALRVRNRVRRPVRMYYVPLLDADLSDGERMALAQAVPIFATMFRYGTAVRRAENQRGGRILITCNKGVNRSALVTALVLDEVYGCGGEEAMRTVKLRRVVGKRALENPHFVHFLKQIPPRPHGVRRLTSEIAL